MKTILIVALITTFQIPTLLACSVRNLKKEYASHEEQIKEHSVTADAIFVGKVVEQETIPINYWDGTTNYYDDYHLIRVSTVFKGNVSRYIEYIRPTSCHWAFDKDTEYLFFGRYDSDTKLIFSSYAGTQELNMAVAWGSFKHLNAPIIEYENDLIIRVHK